MVVIRKRQSNLDIFLSAAAAVATDLSQQLTDIRKEIYQMRADIQEAINKLRAQVAENTDREQSAILLIKGIAAQLASMAEAATDLEALKNEVTVAAANLDASSETLGTAISENT